MTAGDEIKFTIDRVEHGYAHDRISGSYVGPATVDDVKKRFYHEYFGGREAWCKDGRFSVVRHID